MAASVMEIFETMAYGPAPEDASEALRWLERHNRRFGHFINGQWTTPGSFTFETRNPATGDLLATVAQGSPADIDAAVSAARQALPAWQALSGHARARFLYALARQVQKHSRLLAVLETLDNGKPIRESRDIDVPLTGRHFLYHAGWAQLLGNLAENGFAGEFAGHEPVGVVGQIIPWNFPLLMFAWKVAPALAAGCTVILKPAEYTPLTAILMAEIAAEIGLPPGVLNLVNGAGETGAALVAHPGLDKIAFTGSTEVGRQIRKATAATPKKLSLELGGKSPYIVFDDADLDSAVEGLVDGIWFNGGQVCCAGSRLLVQERIADRLYDKIKTRMSTLRVGSPLDKAIDLGAIADKVQHDRIGRYIALGVAEGATCWQPGLALPDRGLFLQPTLLTNVAPASTVAQEEIFGPVLTAMTFRTPAEAVELANNTVYGLAACIWSENINVALDVAAQVKAGVVWVNATNLFDAACGFGGYRESGFGREGGPEGMHEYLQPVWRKLTPATNPGEVTEHLPDPKPGSEFSTAQRPSAPSSAAASLSPKVGSQDAQLTRYPAIDRTVKQYINGKQTRPDTGYSFPVHGLDGHLAGHAPLGSRKDIRNAVEAARAASPKWAKQTAGSRAQILYFLAENLSQRRHEIIEKLTAFVGEPQAAVEFDAAIDRTFTYAAWTDKFEGSVHNPPVRMVALALHEPVGVLGVLAPDEAPLLSLLSLILPAIAMGNTVVAVPGEKAATLIGDLYQVCDTSDLPPGVLNLVAGHPLELAKTLAEHDDVDALWSFRGDTEASTLAKLHSAGNLKQVWTDEGHAIDWFDPTQAQGRWYLRHATQTKNIWVPYGE